jgi:heme exporter protein D
MGTHGPYVWGSFGVMALLMILEPWLIARGRKGLIARLKRQFRAERAERNPMDSRRSRN